ncbi:MAG: YkgJ family cysteine cluster protein [Anaerolineae bacterium]
MHALRSACCLLGLLVFSSSAIAKPLAVEDVPEPLKPWVQWVLRGHEHERCPFLQNNEGTHRCRWPSRLYLTLKDTGGSFSQRWLMLQEGWVPLPGATNRWPQGVKLDGKPALILEHGGSPSIYASPGLRTVTGRFAWERLPESLQIPSETGLVSVILNNGKLAFPDIDTGGRLWLKRRETRRGEREGIRNTLEVQVFRRIVDEIPLQIITRIELDVSGENREVLLGRALMPDYIPLALVSPLPARLEPDGRLRVQVRPGRWTIALTARHPGPVDAVTRKSTQGPWPQEEIWVFEARNHLRLVGIQGVESVDPRQTSLPADWKPLPAYRLQPGDTLRLVVKRRGDPHPEPDALSLVRTLWLDFAGRGYTLQDKITGTMTQSWRLEVDPTLKLGRVVVDGQPQFITRRQASQREGVELRRGRINLIADSQLEGTVSHIPAAGWEHDFRRIRATLNLPPGWRLLAASGIDQVRHSWVTRWSLFDLFVVLIIAAAVAKLWGWPWGGVALATLTLLYHEPGAPRQVWLHILAAAALLRVLPLGRFERFIRLYRNVSLLALAIIAFPFVVNQVRLGLFPQLARPWQTLGGPQLVRQEARDMLVSERAVMEEAEVVAPASPTAQAPVAKLGRELSELKRRAGVGALVSPLPYSRYDPKAIIQTGPGLPRWTWRTVQLTWNGPVERDQKIRLVLLPPKVNLVFRLISVLLLAVLVLRVMNVRPGSGGFRIGRTHTAAGALAILLSAGAVPGVAQADIPSDKVLGELRERLLEKPACLPGCAQSPRMRLDIDRDILRARLEIHAQTDVAVPLPGRHGQWRPHTVLLDGKAADGVFQDGSGHLWLRLQKGRHQVLLEGPLPARDRVQLALPLKPHWVEAKTRGWVIEGLHEDGLADDQLQLTRLRGSGSQRKSTALESGTLPPFVRVERTLRLGLEWQVETQVARVSPRGSAVVLELPLLEGESVTSAGVRVEHGKVLVNMAPQQGRMHWQSVLERREKVSMSAPQTSGWTEVWRVDASPIWHVESAGIPVVHHQGQGRWLPEWRPWPGESVSLAITRPEGVEGKTLTVDASSLTVKPGRRAADVEFAVALRSSQGGQHSLTLPADALLQSVRINGTLQPIRQEGRTVTLPVTPSTKTLHLTWRQRSGIGGRFTTPVVDLGVESVNASIQLNVPRNRWVLFTGGPRLGPAVLFWGLLIVIGLVAVGLGRLGRTPLHTGQWILLGVGLSQVPIWSAIIVVGWLFALSARRQVAGNLGTWRFNLLQIGLGVLTVAALSLLYYAIKQGLLGWPEMQIAGNGSSGYLLRWFQDRSGAEFPQAWVLSVPISAYRFLMLAWALWLAFALLRWLRWAWECYSTGGIWRPVSLPRIGRKTESPGQLPDQKAEA